MDLMIPMTTDYLKFCERLKLNPNKESTYKRYLANAEQSHLMHVYVDDELHQLLKNEAKANGISVRALVKAIFREHYHTKTSYHKVELKNENLKNIEKNKEKILENLENFL